MKNAKRCDVWHFSFLTVSKSVKVYLNFKIDFWVKFAL
jgi:hypothetical protein